jgi:glutathione synthase/RimK-type ligase-like ATP-grasp enzyme
MMVRARLIATMPHRPMKIALADCSEEHEGVLTERPLWAALEERGADFERADWEDESVDWASFDVVVVRTTWNYHHARAKFLRWVEQVAGVTTLHNSSEVLAWNSEKSYLRDLEAAGVPVAPTEWFEPGETANLVGAMNERGWTSGFIKPLVGAVASDTHRLRGLDEGAREAEQFLNARLQEQAMMLQPYLSRVETEGEVSVMLIQGEPTHAVRKLAVAGDYRVQDEHGGTDHLVDLDPLLVDLSRQALAVAPGEEPPLYARVDFLFDDDGGAVVNELELVEPMLFFQHRPEAALVLADAILNSSAG